MKIGKTFTVAAPQQAVWAFITDPAKIAPCIPGCEGAKVTGPGKSEAAISVKVGPIRASFRVDIEQTAEQPPDFAAYVTRGEEGSRASRINATSELRLKSLSPAETEVTYTSDINLVGRLGKFGGGMMQKDRRWYRGRFRWRPETRAGGYRDSGRGRDGGAGAGRHSRARARPGLVGRCRRRCRHCPALVPAVSRCATVRTAGWRAKARDSRTRYPVPG